MKDAEGRDLAVRDIVVYIQPGCRDLKRGMVHKLTPKGATIRPFAGSHKWSESLVNRSSSQICFASKPVDLPYTSSLGTIYNASYHVYYDDNSYDFKDLDTLPNFADSIMKHIKKGKSQFYEYDLVSIVGIPTGVQFGVYKHPKTGHTIYLTLVSDG